MFKVKAPGRPGILLKLGIVFFLFAFLSAGSGCSSETRKYPGYFYVRLKKNPTILDPALIVDLDSARIAAKLYNVPTMFENIEDEHDSSTRFVILSDFKNGFSEHDKTSILVKLRDAKEAGSLVHFLQDFDEENINLSKIESRPSNDKTGFGYWFYIDFYGHIDDAPIQRVLKKHESKVTWLGSYVKGKD